VLFGSREYGGERYALELDGQGNVVGLDLPDSNLLTFVYDEYARLLEEVDSLDCKITYECHHLTTLVTQVSYPSGSTWKARYDDKVNLLAEFDALGLKQWCDQEYAYDPCDSLIERRTGLRKI